MVKVVKYIDDKAVHRFIESTQVKQKKPEVILARWDYPHNFTKYDVWGVSVKYNSKMVSGFYLGSFGSFEEAMLWIELDLQVDKDNVIREFHSF